MNRIAAVLAATQHSRLLLLSILCIAGLLIAQPSAAQKASPSPLWSQSGNAAAVAFSPDGTLIAAAHNSLGVYTVKLYQANTGTLVRTLSGHASAILSVVFSHDGQTLASGSQTNIRLWRVSDGELVRTLSARGDCLAFAMDSATLTSGDTNGGTVKVWRCGDGELLSTLNMRRTVGGGTYNPPYQFPLYEHWIPYCLALSKDGQTVAVAIHHFTFCEESPYDLPGIVEIWQVSDGSYRTLFTQSAGDYYGVRCLAFSSDGNTLAVGKSPLQVWDVNAGVRRFTISGDTTALAFARVGSAFASGDGSKVKLWSHTGFSMGTFEGHTSQLTALAFSPNGDTLVSGANDALKRWQLPPPIIQPDTQIRASTNSLYIGDNNYNNDGSQTAGQTKAAGTVAAYYMKLENDGTAPDTFTVVGDGGSAGVQVRYYNALTGGTEITAAITEGGWSTGELAPGDSAEIRQEVTLTAQTPYGSSVQTQITAVSNNDGTRSDTITSTTTRPHQLIGVAIGVNPSSPQLVNTPLQITAIPTGGENVEYRFFYTVNEGPLQEIQPYGIQAARAFTPSTPGQYVFTAWVREQGSTAEKEFEASRSFKCYVPLSGVTISVSPPSPQPIDTPLTITATPLNGGNPEFQYYIIHEGGPITKIKDYTQDRQCLYYPGLDGSYRFMVWVREAGNPIKWEVYGISEPYIVPVTPPTSVSLNVTLPTSQSAPHPIRVVANVHGGGEVECRFFASRNGGPNQEIRAFSRTGAIDYTPPLGGSYTFTVWARSVGFSNNPSVYQVAYTTPTSYRYYNFSMVALTASPSSPQLINTPITFTATPNDEVDVEYRFFMDDGTGFVPFGVFQYSRANSCTWTPTTVGTYTLLVWARKVGNTTAKDCYATLTYRVTDTTPLTNVTLTATPHSPQRLNHPVTLTATPTGGMNVEYRFYLYENNAWTVLQEYSAVNSCSWTPTVSGKYTLLVWAQEHGAPPNANGYQYQVYATVHDYLVQAPLSSVALAATPSGQTLSGQPITLTATTAGGCNVEYRFFKVFNGVTTTLQNYTLNANTFQLIPTEVGQYQFIVWAREPGSTARMFSTVMHRVNPSLSGVSLTASPASPQPPGTQVTLTATPVGGAQVEYRFYAAEPGGALQIIQPYSTANTCAFTVTQQGTYQFLVYVREVGSTVAKQAYKSIAYTVATPITSVDLAATPSSPRPRNTPITLTATAHGGYMVQYRFFVITPAGQTVTLQNYTEGDNTCTYTPTAPGSYTFLVWVRETGSSRPSKDAYKSITYTVQ